MTGAVNQAIAQRLNSGFIRHCPAGTDQARPALALRFAPTGVGRGGLVPGADQLRDDGDQDRQGDAVGLGRGQDRPEQDRRTRPATSDRPDAEPRLAVAGRRASHQPLISEQAAEVGQRFQRQQVVPTASAPTSQGTSPGRDVDALRPGDELEPERLAEEQGRRPRSRPIPR